MRDTSEADNQTQTETAEVAKANGGLALQRVNAFKVNGLRTPPDPELITADELANRWRMQRVSIRYYMKRGLLKPVKLLNNRQLKFEMSEIQRTDRT